MQNILVACHDAGGAELVASWVKHQENVKVVFSLAGPAERIFSKYFDLKNEMKLKVGESLPKIDFILTGTSWTSDFEMRWVEVAKKNGIRVATFLDHWTNYRTRFQLNGNSLFPDVIWVGDPFALKLAKKEFPEVPIEEKKNHFILDSIERMRGLHKEHSGKNILYVTEPTSVAAELKEGNPRYYGYTEFEALEAYLEYLKKNAEPGTILRLRTHPSEPTDKFDAILRKFRGTLTIENSREADVIEDCIWSDTIVGCNTMVMALGVYAKKNVLCSIPNPKSQLILPFPEIQRLFS